MKRGGNPKETYMLIALAYALAFLLLSGKMHLFLSPRFIPFDYFALVFVSMLAAYKFFYRKDDVRVDKVAVVVFIFFMIIALFVPPVKTVDADVFGSISAEGANDAALYEIAKGEIGPEPTGEIMNFTDESWSEMHSELYSNLSGHVGDRIAVSGFVYKTDSLPDGQFIVGRYLMWCCVADAIPKLIVVESNYTEYISNEWWLHVEGNISATINNQTGEIMPLVLPESIDIIEEGNYYIYSKAWK